MERFTIQLDNNSKGNINGMCRLCGMNNPRKIPIFSVSDENNIGEHDIEPALFRKISDCIGIQIGKEDHLPQSVCSLCYDKINDFYEFREMCISTDMQTRTLLGLPNLYKDMKVEECPSESILGLEENKDMFPIIEDSSLNNSRKRTKCMKSSGTMLPKEQSKIRCKEKGRKSHTSIQTTTIRNESNQSKSPETREAQGKVLKKPGPHLKNIQNKSTNSEKQDRTKRARTDKLRRNTFNKFNKELKSTEFVVKGRNLRNSRLFTKSDVRTNINKFKSSAIRQNKNHGERIEIDDSSKFTCEICKETFQSVSTMECHLKEIHVPKVIPYHCIYCNETITEKSNIRNHNLWHKLSKTPYKCGRCDRIIETLIGYTKHVHECSTFKKLNIFVTKHCDQCNKDFETQNLFDWHLCVTKKRICPKCKRKLPRKYNVIRHVIKCEGLRNSRAIRSNIVDNDIKIDVSTSNNSLVEAVQVTTLKSNECVAINPNEIKCEAFYTGKSDRRVKQELEQCNILLNNSYMTLVNVKNESSETSEIAVSKIKQEKSNNSENNAICMNSVQQISNADSLSIESVKPTIKLKITKEHGTLNSSFVGDDRMEILPHKKKKDKKKKLTKQRSQCLIKKEVHNIDNENVESYSEEKAPNVNDVESNSSSFCSSETGGSVHDTNFLKNHNDIDQRYPIMPIIASVASGVNLSNEVDSKQIEHKQNSTNSEIMASSSPRITSVSGGISEEFLESLPRRISNNQLIHEEEVDDMKQYNLNVISFVEKNNKPVEEKNQIAEMPVFTSDAESHTFSNVVNKECDNYNYFCSQNKAELRDCSTCEFKIQNNNVYNYLEQTEQNEIESFKNSTQFHDKKQTNKRSINEIYIRKEICEAREEESRCRSNLKDEYEVFAFKKIKLSQQRQVIDSSNKDLCFLNEDICNSAEGSVTKVSGNSNNFSNESNAISQKEYDSYQKSLKRCATDDIDTYNQFSKSRVDDILSNNNNESKARGLKEEFEEICSNNAEKSCDEYKRTCFSTNNLKNVTNEEGCILKTINSSDSRTINTDTILHCRSILYDQFNALAKESTTVTVSGNTARQISELGEKETEDCIHLQANHLVIKEIYSGVEVDNILSGQNSGENKNKNKTVLGNFVFERSGTNLDVDKSSDAHENIHYCDKSLIRDEKILGESVTISNERNMYENYINDRIINSDLELYESSDNQVIIKDRLSERDIEDLQDESNSSKINRKRINVYTLANEATVEKRADFQEFDIGQSSDVKYSHNVNMKPLFKSVRLTGSGNQQLDIEIPQFILNCPTHTLNI